jgi:hypothetical protein
LSEEANDNESRAIFAVQSSTRVILESMKAKIGGLSPCSKTLAELLRFGVDYPAAAQTAKEFFGTDTVGYVAVDGTNALDQQLDLLVFYVGAFGYRGTVKFTSTGVDCGTPRAEADDVSVSTAIPLSEEDGGRVSGKKTESGVDVDLERLPNAVMHLAEYYLAYTAASRPDPAKVILLDRTLAGDVAHLVWSTRELIRTRSSVLLGVQTPRGKVTPFDMELVRMLVANPSLSIPAPRSQLLRYAAVLELLKGEALTAKEIIANIGANPAWEERLDRDLAKLEKWFGVFEEMAPYRLRPDVGGYWDRVLVASTRVTQHIFNTKSGHPLRYEKGGAEAWITAEDIDFLILVYLRALTNLAWSGRSLMIGLTKDTSAFELIKSALPVLFASQTVKEGAQVPDFGSDKMLLQTNSVMNGKDIPTPWHTPEIDAAFRTVAPIDDRSLRKGEARVMGAYRNVIIPERLYLKTYIQLWSSKSNPSIRSHVFTFDRPVYPSFDHWDEVVLRHKDGTVEEEIHPVVHFMRGSPVTNLAMCLLTEMGGEVIPEALGHNYPLFLADKKAKAVLEGARKAYLGAVTLEIAKSDLDQQVLFSRRFRDYRSQVEGRRSS